MSDMKLIMESWRHYQLAEQNPPRRPPVTTVGQLKKLIHMHRAAAAGKEVAVQGIETTIEQIPGVNNIYSIWKGIKGSKDALTKLYFKNAEAAIIVYDVTNELSFEKA